MRLLFYMLSATLVLPAAALAKTACPPREEGNVPWGSAELMDGDKWAWVFLDIDAGGHVRECRIGTNNMNPELRAKTCMSFTRNWKAVPVLQDGKPGPATIKRHFVALGRKHYKANEKARKSFFLDHPEERPECYPG